MSSIRLFKSKASNIRPLRVQFLPMILLVKSSRLCWQLQAMLSWRRWKSSSRTHAICLWFHILPIQIRKTTQIWFSCIHWLTILSIRQSLWEVPIMMFTTIWLSISLIQLLRRFIKSASLLKRLKFIFSTSWFKDFWESATLESSIIAMALSSAWSIWVSKSMQNTLERTIWTFWRLFSTLSQRSQKSSNSPSMIFASIYWRSWLLISLMFPKSKSAFTKSVMH